MSIKWNGLSVVQLRSIYISNQGNWNKYKLKNSFSSPVEIVCGVNVKWMEEYFIDTALRSFHCKFIVIVVYIFKLSLSITSSYFPRCNLQFAILYRYAIHLLSIPKSICILYATIEFESSTMFNIIYHNVILSALYYTKQGRGRERSAFRFLKSMKIYVVNRVHEKPCTKITLSL